MPQMIAVMTRRTDYLNTDTSLFLMNRPRALLVSINAHFHKNLAMEIFGNVEGFRVVDFVAEEDDILEVATLAE